MGFLRDKVAIVLGASARGNIGEATARHLIDQGATVVVAARSEGPLKAVAEALGATPRVCDIADEDSVEALKNFTLDRFGRLDIGVNTAGVAVSGDFQTTSLDDLRTAFDVHLCGTFLFFKYLSQAMKEGGSLVTLSSATAFTYTPAYVAYQATKCAADNLVRTAAVEFGPLGIRVNSVVRSFTDDTPMTRDYQKMPGLNELFLKEIPLGRLNTVKDVAHAITWLCHDDSYVTGQAIHVSGGNHLLRLPSSAEMSTL